MTERVLVVGATSAIAADIARLYANRGARLVLIARNAERVAALASTLGSAVVATRTADFTDTAAAEPLVSAAWEALGGLDVVCIAHGLLGDQLATERDVRAAEEVIATNFTSVVAFVIPVANRMQGAGTGHIAVLSSVAGDRGRPRNYTYGAAKAGLSAYLQGLRTRLWPDGVQVHTFKLGPVDTPMTATHRKHALFAKPATVAARVVAAIDAGVPEAYVPGFWRPIMSVVRNAPERLIQRLPFLSGR